MLPRIQPSSMAISSILRCGRPIKAQRQYATAAAIPRGASQDQMNISSPLMPRYPLTQPPSHKPPEFRKSQLLRQYASLLRSSPLMLLFQHNNLKSNEWVSIRRELAINLARVDEALAKEGYTGEPMASAVKIQIIQTGIFSAALRVVEYFKPEVVPALDPTDPAAPSSASIPAVGEDTLVHTLSEAAHQAATKTKVMHALDPLLSGPLMVVTLPSVSPQHLKAIICSLAPSAPQFPAPARKTSPGWHDPLVQTGLQKLILLGARVEGRVFDVDGAKWVGSMGGGLDVLRGQLVNMLQAIGAGVTHTLESAAKNIYFTVESRRSMLEEEGKPAAPATEPKE